MIRSFLPLPVLFLSIASFSQTLTFETIAEGGWVKENGEKVLFYQSKTKSVDGKFARANYIHPLYNIDGFELTEDFPKDHLHHRGIFWTWHQVIIGDKQIGDAWECKDFIWDVTEFISNKSETSSISFFAKVLWKSEHWKDAAGNLKPFVQEKSTIKVYAKKDNYRVIDYEISLLALENDLKIGGSNDHKGYGGFSVRMKLPKDVIFSSGLGTVEPQTTQVSAGPWMNVSGALAASGGNGGVVMMCHPDNPGYPEPWILRKKGSMQNPAYPGKDPTGISTDRPTVLKYRLVTYTGELETSVIDKIFEQYKN